MLQRRSASGKRGVVSSSLPTTNYTHQNPSSSMISTSQGISTSSQMIKGQSGGVQKYLQAHHHPNKDVKSTAATYSQQIPTTTSTNSNIVGDSSTVNVNNSNNVQGASALTTSNSGSNSRFASRPKGSGRRVVTEKSQSATDTANMVQANPGAPAHAHAPHQGKYFSNRLAK